MSVLSTLLFLHHLVWAWRQIQKFFGEFLREVREDVAKTDKAKDPVAIEHRERPVPMLLERGQRLAQ
jgi:hypothetical protein